MDDPARAIADTTIDILHKRRRHDFISPGRALKSINPSNPYFARKET